MALAVIVQPQGNGISDKDRVVKEGRIHHGAAGGLAFRGAFALGRGFGRNLALRRDFALEEVSPEEELLEEAGSPAQADSIIRQAAPRATAFQIEFNFIGYLFLQNNGKWVWQK